MENWCSNSVRFSGAPGATHAITWLFRAMSALEKETGQAQRPPFITGNDGYIQNIDFFDRTIFFETPAVPDIDFLVQVADRYGSAWKISSSSVMTFSSRPICTKDFITTAMRKS